MISSFPRSNIHMMDLSANSVYVTLYSAWNLGNLTLIQILAVINTKSTYEFCPVTHALYYK